MLVSAMMDMSESASRARGVFEKTDPGSGVTLRQTPGDCKQSRFARFAWERAKRCDVATREKVAMRLGNAPQTLRQPKELRQPSAGKFAATFTKGSVPTKFATGNHSAVHLD